MKVADNTQALKDYLAQQYQRAIQQVKQDAKQTRKQLLSEYEQKGEAQAEALMQQAKRQAKSEQTSTIASAKQQARREEQQAISELMHEIQRLVLTREHAKPKQQREDLIKRLQDNLRESLTQQGYDPEEFSFQQDLDELSVRAETQDVLVEDSVAQRVQEQKQAIVKDIMEQAQ